MELQRRSRSAIIDERFRQNASDQMSLALHHAQPPATDFSATEDVHRTIKIECSVSKFESQGRDQKNFG